MDGLEEQSDEPVATKNGAIEEGCALLPCADLTCPCRVMKRAEGQTVGALISMVGNP